MTLNNRSVPEEKNLGVMSLFGSWKLAKKSLLVILGWFVILFILEISVMNLFCRICYMLIYFILFLNVSNLKGNPFLNYFWQGLAELPGYFLGKYLSDAIGRKYTKFASFIAIGTVAIILAYVLSCSYLN